MAPNSRAKETAKQIFCGHLGWVLSLFLIGLGVKFMLVLHSDSPLPYLDQWEAEAANTYLPYFHHTLSFIDLFKAHNEHRIVWTKLYDLGLLLVNGQWDSELQMTLNAVIHCAALAGFGWLMARLMGKENWPFIWLPLVLALALPFAWENTLAGFQSQFYFMVIFALLTIWLLGMSKPLSLRWWLGLLAGVLGLFTMASGFLGALAVAAICLLDIVRDRSAWRRHLPTLRVCAALLVAGLLLKAHVPRHDIFQARSVSMFGRALGINLAWPSSHFPALVPLNLLPLILLAWMYSHSKKEPSTAERLTLALGAWGILQGMAAAYARGFMGDLPAWRYMDTLSFIMIANCLSIVLLVKHYRPSLAWRPFWYVAFVLWGVACASGLWYLTGTATQEAIPAWQARQTKRLAHARAFMATDDPRAFDTRYRDDLPHPDAAGLVIAFRDKDIRRILPACVREPLHITPAGDTNGAFVLNGSHLAGDDASTEHCWGSFSGAGTAAQGKFESLPITPGAFPYLEIPIAGDLGESGLTLELIESQTGKVTPVSPTAAPGEKWANVYVKTPARAFKILARDDSKTKWFAFKEPREMGWLSYSSRRMLKTWKFCLVAGAACLFWSLATFARSKKTGDCPTAQ